MSPALPPEYQPCRKPDCRRKVRRGVMFCCSPCSLADHHGHEIHAHSPGCDGRAAERGEYTSP